jgi:hypothetical protein
MKKQLLNQTSNNCFVTQAFLSDLQNTGKQILFFSLTAWELKKQQFSKALQQKGQLIWSSETLKPEKYLHSLI